MTEVSWPINPSISWSTGHSDQMEEKINVAHQDGMASTFHLFNPSTYHHSALNLLPFPSNLKYSIHLSFLLDHLIIIFKILRVSKFYE